MGQYRSLKSLSNFYTSFSSPDTGNLYPKNAIGYCYVQHVLPYPSMACAAQVLEWPKEANASCLLHPPEPHNTQLLYTLV